MKFFTLPQQQFTVNAQTIKPLLIKRLWLLIIFFSSSAAVFSQNPFVSTAPVQNGSITAAEYGNCSGATVGGTGGSWYMAWDNTNLYIAKTGSSSTEPVIMYFNLTPNSSANGGVASGSGGQTTGKNDYSNTPNLPFLANARVFWTGSYAEVSINTGSGWGGALTTGLIYNTGSTSMEIKIPWTVLNNGSGIPAAFNWLGTASSTGSPGYIYDPYPTVNYVGNSTGTPTYYYYQTVDATASGSATNPFNTGRESFTNYNNGSYVYTSSLPTTLFDFTLGNTSGSAAVSLQTGIAVGRDVVVKNGTLNVTNGTAETISMTNTAGNFYIFTASGGHVYGTDNGGGNDLNLQVNTGANIAFGGDASASGTNSDDHKFFNATVQSGATLALNKGILVRYGSFSVAGTLQINAGGYVEGGASGAVKASYSSGSLIYANGNNYNVTDFEWPTTNSPTNVTIQSSNTAVTLNNSKTVAGTLTLSSGTTTTAPVVTGANTLIIGASGSISGASSVNYINGNLGWIFSSAVSHTFPIGNGNNNYHPVTFNYTSLTGTSTVTIADIESAYTPTIPSSARLFNTRYWNVSQSGGTAFNYKISLDPTGFTPLGTAVILKSDNSATATSNAATTPNYTNTAAFTTIGSTNSSFALAQTNIPLTITGVTANGKVYDGTTVASLNAGSALLSGVISPDVVSINAAGATGIFSSRNIGSNTVSTSGFALSGTNAGPYVLSAQPSAGSATITVRPITVTANTDTKVYDGSTSSSVSPTVPALQTGDAVGTTPTQTFDIKNAGTGKMLTASGLLINDGNSGANYSISYANNTTGVINALPLNFTGTKTVDGNATFSASQLSANNIITGDVVTLGGSATVSASSVNTYTSFVTNSLTASNSNYAVTGGTVNVSITSCTTDTWTGAASNDWNDGTNWSCGAPPAPTANVSIPPSAAPSLSTDVIVNNLAIGSSATVSINGYKLTINGAFSGTGTITGSTTSKLVTTGTTGTLNFTSGAEKLSTLTTSGGSAALGTKIDIYDSLVVSGGTLNLAAQSVTIKSTATATACVSKITGTLSGATNVTVERYIPANSDRAWRLLSIPTQTTQSIHQSWQENQATAVVGITGLGTLVTSPIAAWAANGFDYQTYSSSMLKYNSAGNSWDSITNTSASIATTSGYFLYIRGDRGQAPSANTTPTSPTVLRTTGALYQGTQTATGVASGKFGLIGNVYASAIDFTALTLNNIDPVFYVWDPKVLNLPPSLGAYVTFSSVTVPAWKPVPAGGSYTANTPNTYIQSGQAFFVHASGTGSVQLSEGSKVTGSAMVFRPDSPGSISGQLATNLYRAGGNLADGNIAVFNSAYSNAVDGTDALKLSNTQENFGILRGGKELIIEARQPVATTDTIFFDMWNIKQQPYTLEFEATNLNTAGLSAVLEDSYLNTKTPVDLNSASSSTGFTVDGNAGSSARNRFRLVFTNSQPVPVTFTALSAVQQGIGVAVSWKVAGEIGIQQYVVERSTDGIHFTTAGTVTAKGSSNYSLQDAAATIGNNYYRIRSVSVSGVVKYTSIVKVTLGSIKPSVAIYPNPVEDGRLNVQLTNQPTGKYGIRLFNVAGQSIFETELSHPGGSGSQTVNVPASLARGIYKLEVVLPGNIIHTEKVVIK